MGSPIQLKFLGTGTSVGVPQIGCTCSVCSSDSPKNKRLRSSLLITHENTRVLIDSSPDLRQQALREHISAIDAVVYTHGHLDHVAGFDDLRAFCWKREDRLPLYASPGTMNTLNAMYPWAFSPDNNYRGYVRPEPIIIDGPFNIGTLRFTPVPLIHADVETYGYLVEAGQVRVGYAPDVKEVPDASKQLWQNLDILILDALRYSPHRTHMTVDETLDVIRELAPRNAFLTHMSHEIDYDIIQADLPSHIRAAYDGLTLTLDTKPPLTSQTASV